MIEIKQHKPQRSLHRNGKYIGAVLFDESDKDYRIFCSPGDFSLKELKELVALLEKL